MYKKIVFVVLLLVTAFCYCDEKTKEKKFDKWGIKLEAEKATLTISDNRDEKYLKYTFITGNFEDLETVYKALNNEYDCINLNLEKLGFISWWSKSNSIDQKTGTKTGLTSISICREEDCPEE